MRSSGAPTWRNTDQDIAHTIVPAYFARVCGWAGLMRRSYWPIPSTRPGNPDDRWVSARAGTRRGLV